ncbi:Di-trans-poly-cis-decaprenylcistransferase [Aspergillus heteromorphus CBS 117.55]|uniref:Di-trans-poly-cis-decaprenylcistransferase n=1 Tax=Aspergillus heteromorphus CBS 117.55 TaxID=1448321 RepID=A0A317WTN3_9EURO|nr:Di-trans-poly-cis-decaprenylcistransferase [Aspergillus heteromorphus CBS 117.55]PWY87600.1 Di-trans-poly-cis-decaprenylcistransferase [Aspergillus heteromorphus CBS 117.55]
MSTSTSLSRFRKWLLASPPIEFAISQVRDLLVGALRQGPMPQHIAFVMDGNRRFARSHGIETVEGHNLGFEALARILEVCYKSGVKVVTIYAFSIENFKRSKFEVDALMEMARVKLSQMAQHGEILDRYGAKVRVLGRLDLLRPDVLAAVNRAVDMTSKNGDCILNICFPYTSRDEITSAIRDTVADYSAPLSSTRSSSGSPRTPFCETHITQNIRAQALNTTNIKTEDLPSDTETASASSGEGGGPKPTPNHVYENGSSFSSSSTLHLPGQQENNSNKPPAASETPGSDSSPRKEPPIFLSPESITRQTLDAHLFTRDNPPLDLLVRTSGVERLSDFMLWQCHEETEIVFLDILWPDFDLWHFLPVLIGWQRRISKSKKNPDAEGNFDGGPGVSDFPEDEDVVVEKVKDL